MNMSAVNMSDILVPLEDTSALTMKPVGLVSDQIRVILNWILCGALLLIICCFGIASNIINIICFVRQGLTDPVNVSVLALAVSDLGSLVTATFTGISYHPIFPMLDLPVEMIEFGYIVIAPPHFLFTGMSSWITALIALERCLCITMPLKVTRIVTPKRVVVIIVCIFTAFTCSASLLLFVGKLSWVYTPERNRTVLRLVYTEHSDIVEQMYFSLNGALIPFSAYFMNVICTLTLVFRLREKSKWRKTCISTVLADNTSKRDQQVSKMVVMISALFIVCYTPICISVICLTAVPELAIDGPNQNILYIFTGVSMVLQSGNSSANIFIYYRMSSRYKSTFRELFRDTEDTKIRTSVPDKAAS